VSFELGLDTALEPIGSFRYTALDATSGLVEREDDTVLVGYVGSDIELAANPAEVWATRFVSIQELKNELATSPNDSTPWLADALDCALRAGHPRL
jgi:isopentenyl-diphosphate delta-isomerase